MCPHVQPTMEDYLLRYEQYCVYQRSSKEYDDGKPASAKMLELTSMVSAFLVLELVKESC